MSSLQHSNVVTELVEEYRDNNYTVIAEEQEYPGIFLEKDQPQGRVDILLEDGYVPEAYKIVQILSAESLSPRTLQTSLDEKADRAEKARKYFNSNVNDADFKSEVRVGTRGKLNTVRELWENTMGVFTWDQAKEAVSNRGKLDQLKNEDYLLLSQEVSRRENEEYFEFSPELDSVTDFLLKNKTYP